MIGGHRFRFAAPDGRGSWVTHYCGVIDAGDAQNQAPPVGALHPVAFLVEMDPERTLRPHFHLADQFQLFVTGDGTFGREPVHVLTLHYADAYTPYGPILSGTDGLGYLTLRNGWDPGFNFMPESREALRAAQRKPRATSAEVPPSRGAGATAILPSGTDGLFAAHVAVAAGTTYTGPDPATGRGQYWLRLPAERRADIEWQQQVDLTFVAPSEPARSIGPPPDDEEVFVLQFPARHAA